MIIPNQCNIIEIGYTNNNTERNFTRNEYINYYQLFEFLKTIDCLDTYCSAYLYDNQEAVVVYVADHGEEVYDDLPVSGRLHQKPTKQIARQEFEVPMWIWCSKKYQEAHGDVVVRLREYRKRPFISSDISQMLFHLAGLRCKWYDECRDILSPQYKVPKRIIAGEVDYDSFYKTTYIQIPHGIFAPTKDKLI